MRILESAIACQDIETIGRQEKIYVAMVSIASCFLVCMMVVFESLDGGQPHNRRWEERNPSYQYTRTSNRINMSLKLPFSFQVHCNAGMPHYGVVDVMFFQMLPSSSDNFTDCCWIWRPAMQVFLFVSRNDSILCVTFPEYTKAIKNMTESSQRQFQCVSTTNASIRHLQFHHRENLLRQDFCFLGSHKVSIYLGTRWIEAGRGMSSID
jgi:hypothetical protein